MSSSPAETWLRAACAAYEFDLAGILRTSTVLPEPPEAAFELSLAEALKASGRLLPLPKEPAALANIIEVSVVNHIAREAEAAPGVECARGTERGYPDIELSGTALGSVHHAVDIKVARRKDMKRGVPRNTQSRITLYTGNTYFRYPTLKWPGTFRPFANYSSHLDVVVLYTLDEARDERVTDVELIVQPPWKIASHQRSSTTREYIGAVTGIEALRNGEGEFPTEAEFYRYWRKYNFVIGKAVQQQLDRLLTASNGDQP